MNTQTNGTNEEFDKNADNDAASQPHVPGNDEKFLEAVELYRKKEWKSALSKFLSTDISILNFDEKMEHTYYLGLCYTKLEHYEEALSFLEQVVTSSSDILRVYQCRMTLAYIYVITKRAKMSEYELKRLQSSGMESTLLYNTLAYAAWLQRQHKNAVDLYEKSLELDSENATAMNSMGFILADTGMDIMRALRLCRKAVDSKPQSAAYLDSLGWAYYKSGELLEARTWLRRALDIAPDEEVIQKHFKIVSGAQR